MEKITDRLFRRLREIDKSPADFAREIGENDQVVHNWKKRGAIPAKKLPKVARALNETVDWLLSEEKPLNFGAMEDSKHYTSLPIELLEIWQNMDTSMRTHLLAIARTLVRKNKEK